ncbi:MAG: hypothetical protein GY765_00790, partial [bacterium]|nr:hypothetical protein [bacterium]
KDEKYLCVYYVTTIGEPEKILREHLMKNLPGYMIPTHFVRLEKIPLTPNGKVDLKALPEPAADAAGKTYVPPAGHIEHKLVDIWAKLLEIPRQHISMEDNFFHLGGHSLKATRMIARIHKEMDVRIPVAQVFDTPTIGRLAAYIENTGDVADHKFLTMEPAEEKEYYPLSPAQKRFYLLQQIVPGSIAYNIFEQLEITGPLDGKKIETIFQTLIRRHESLRTTFETIKGKTVQRVHRNMEFRVETSLEQEEKEIMGDGAEIINKFVRPFRLSRSPLIRVGIIKMAPLRNILAI